MSKNSILKYGIILLLFPLLLVQKGYVQDKEALLHLMPYPNHVVKKNKAAVIHTRWLKIFEDFKETSTALEHSNFDYLKTNLQSYNAVNVYYANKDEADIIIQYKDIYSEDESYLLKIENNKVYLEGSSIGVFRGIQTFLQLFEQFYETGTEFISLPELEIEDEPYLKYRGMHLDVSRHFFDVQQIKKIIDVIARFKINNFHWHLSNDQGWRIEIKKYPRLTEIGSKRKETVLNKNISPYLGDGIPYSGHYTQEQVKEIVTYAEKRKINIIPEIDVPGHVTAMLAAYPFLGCNKGPYEVSTVWGTHKNLLCVGDEHIYFFLERVFDEILALFPSEYIHIGGDEVDTEIWEQCNKCQALVEKENLGDTKNLHHYFVSRMAKYLEAKGRKVIGWDEIYHEGLSKDITVMSWQGNIELAKLNQHVIMTPNKYLYFDHYQSDNENEPLAFGGNTSIDAVYNYDPVPLDLDGKHTKKVLGVQANVWTEYISTLSHLEYMIFPRLLALSEIAWTKPENKNFHHFNQRLIPTLKYLGRLNVNYSTSNFNVKVEVLPHKPKQVKVKLSSSGIGGDIKYSVGGFELSDSAIIYKEPFIIKEETEFYVQYFQGNTPFSYESYHKINVHKAVGADISMNCVPSPEYDPGSSFALVNGVFGNEAYNNGEWFGFRGENHFEVVVKYSNSTNIKFAGINYLTNFISWIHPPKSISVYTSLDGQNYELISKEAIDDKKNGITRYRVPVNKRVKYLKVTAENAGIISSGLPGAGYGAWMFIDEVVVD